MFKKQYYIVILICFIFISLSKANLDSLQNALILYKSNSLEKGNTLFDIGDYYYYQNESDSALQYYYDAQIIFKELKDNSKAADCDITIGIVYEFSGDYSKAISYYDSAYLLYQKDKNHEGMSYSLNNIGIVYSSYGDYKKALDYFQKSLKIEDEINNDIGKAYSLNNIGLIQRKMGLSKEAIKYYKKSLEIKTKLNDTSGIALTSCNIGSAFEDLNEFEKAEEFYNISLKNYTQIESFEGIAYALNNLGSIAEKDNDLVKAEELFTESLKYRTQIGDQKGIAISLASIGNLKIKQNKATEAIDYISKSNRIAKEMHLKEEIKENYLYFSEAYLLLKNFDKSLEYYKMYSQLKDSILNEETNKQISELNIKYETERKELEIVNKNIELDGLQKEKALQSLEIKRGREQIIFLIVLSLLIIAIAIIIFSRYRIKKRNNEILSSKNLELKEINASKNKFFSIFSHDIKNPFGTLVSISNHLENEYNELDDDSKKEIIRTINKSAELTYELLENLLTWSQTQTGRLKYTPEKISISELIHSNIQLLDVVAKKKGIEISFKENSQSFVYADIEMAKTILRNLLSNALKFSKNNGKINIDLNEKNNQLFISITDTGIGMSDEDTSKLFRIDVNTRKIGKSKEKGTGLGLIICKEFVEINKGNIFVESILDKGSTFTFTLPIAKE